MFTPRLSKLEDSFNASLRDADGPDFLSGDTF